MSIFKGFWSFAGFVEGFSRKKSTELRLERRNELKECKRTRKTEKKARNAAKLPLRCFWGALRIFEGFRIFLLDCVGFSKNESTKKAGKKERGHERKREGNKKDSKKQERQ